MSDDFEKFLIKRYTYWKVYLHGKFHYHLLGSTYIWARREGDFDLLDMTPEEEKEFFEIARELKKILKELFQPDRFNYMMLANVSSHLHIHMIPRYKGERTFDGIKFVDKRWGQPLDSVPDISVPESTLLKLRDAIKAKLTTLQ